MKKFAVVLVALAALSWGVTGCGFGNDKSREDANDVHNVCAEGIARTADAGCVDKTSPSVVAFNNHYPNVEIKCDGYGHRLFTMTHDSAQGRNLIVLPDPSCPGYVKGEEPSVVVAGG